MNVGYATAIQAVPFLDLLDAQCEGLALEVVAAPDEGTARVAMQACHRRLAQSVHSVLRSLPTSVRSDASLSGSVAYALVGLADERMLHHPAGGLDAWRAHLLEHALYRSSLAGDELVKRAQAAVHGPSPGGDGARSDPQLLGPLYLGIFRAGFEGSLRGDALGLSTLVESLEETIGGARERVQIFASDDRPLRIGLSPALCACAGIVLWLATGVAVWSALATPHLAQSARLADRIESGRRIVDRPVLDRSVGPSSLGLMLRVPTEAPEAQ